MHPSRSFRVRRFVAVLLPSLAFIVTLWLSRASAPLPAIDQPQPDQTQNNDRIVNKPDQLEEEDEDKPRPDRPNDAMLFRRLSLQDENGKIPFDGLIRAAEHAKAMQAYQSAHTPDAGGIVSGTWTWLGPGNIGGRIRSIVISPTNANKLWIGSVSGGIWTTSDGGASWQVVDDFLANLAVSTMVVNPITPAIMYAGTGEGFYNIDGIQGAGVFTSIDGGVTWTQLASTNNANWYYTNRLAISPNGSTLLAATQSGLWRSIDGGASWSHVTTTRTLDVDFDPGNSAKAIASGGANDAYYSTNGGVTWFPASGIPAGGRVEVAYAPSNPAMVYASIDRNRGELYQSANGGQTYSLVNTGNAYLGTQGWYDNVVWVDPTNANIVVVGGIDLWRSVNGGTTLTRISQWFSAPDFSAHADHHAIVNDPNFNGTSNRTVFFGNDGGIYKAADVYAVALTSGWQELNNNLGITQFYGAAGNATSGVIIGGTQDNGTPRYIGGTETWTTMFGGDGGFDAADQTDSNYFYGEYVYLCIHRSSDGGVSADYICGQYWNGSAWVWKADPYRIPDAQAYQANFIAPFIIDPSNANRLLAGGWSLWRTNDAKTANTSSTGPSWASLKAPTTGNSPISAIAIAQGNSNIVWVGHNNGDVYTTTNGTAVTPTWTRVDTNSPALPNRMVMRIAIDPANSQVVYVSFGGFSPDNVWRTTDGGLTWADITGSGAAGLPDAPVRSIVINPNISKWLYVGTEVGIFASEDGGTTWGVPHDGPANVSVDELVWIGNYTLIAATHGRGIYRQRFDAAVSIGSKTRSELVGNGNGGVDPGETIGLQIGLTNGGPAAATGVLGTLKLVSGNATLITPTASYANIASGATQTNTLPIAFQVNPAQPCGSPLTFVFTATYNVTRTAVQTFTIPIGAPTLGVTTTYTSTDVPKSIPDNDPLGVNSILTIASAGSIGDVDARLNSITHTYDGDLVIQLTSPTGTPVTLINRRGSDGQNFVNTILDDNATTPIASGAAPFTGRFQPDGSLASFNSQAINGTWTLNVSDRAAVDTGTLNGWSLDIRPTVYACTPYTPTTLVQFSSAAYSVNENASSATISVTLSAAAAQTATVNYATSDGTAIAPNDYAASSGTLTFTPGVTLATFTVPIVNDTLHENSETINLALSNPTNLTPGSPSAAVLTIVDDDPVPAVQFSSAIYSVNENNGAATITVTLNATSGVMATVNYATANGTAIAPNDYLAASGTLTFMPGVTQTTFNVTIVDDALHENDETINLTLSSASNATLGSPNPATLTIVDNDPSPTVQFTSSTYTVNEGAGTALITVTLNTASAVTATVTYATSNNTAIAPGDYLTATGTLTFTPGVTQTTFNVTIVDDALVEGTESLTVTLSTANNAALGAPSAAALYIIDNDIVLPTVQFTSAAYNVNEGSGSATITVTLSFAPTLTATVDYAMSDGTATAGDDYLTATGTLTFTPGVTLATFTVPIVNDTLHENSETINLALSNPTNLTPGSPSAATVTIIDNDPVPAVQFSSATYNVNENNGAATITVTLNAASGVTATVNYATSNGTAIAPNDYLAASGTLTFMPGLTQTTFNVTIVDDTLHENNETINLTLSGANNATLGSPNPATLTIVDNDPLPAVQFASATYTVNEGAGTALITVTLDTASAVTATVTYATSNNTAIAPGDYVTATGMLTFTPGLTRTTFTVPIVDDALVEGTESLTVTLSNANNATLGAPSTAALYIIDNDIVLPTVQFSSAAYSVSEGAGSATITITLSFAPTLTATVDYAMSDGTATAGDDYLTATGTLTFTPGVTISTFTVPIVDDVLLEPPETINLALSNWLNAAPGAPTTAVLTIGDNDYGVFLPIALRP